MADSTESFVDKAKRFVAEMVAGSDYTTETARRNNDVKRGVATYKQQGHGGAAANAAEAIKSRKKMLDDL